MPLYVSALPDVATLLPFKYNTPLAVPPERVAVLTVKLVPEIFVMLALVPVSVVTVAEVTVTLVRDKLLIVRLPTRATVNDASAQVRLEGFVPTSIMALLELMLKSRLSAVLTASSAPPAAFVKFAVAGTAPGVLLRLVRIVGISKLPR